MIESTQDEGLISDTIENIRLEYKIQREKLHRFLEIRKTYNIPQDIENKIHFILAINLLLDRINNLLELSDKLREKVIEKYIQKEFRESQSIFQDYKQSYEKYFAALSRYENIILTLYEKISSYYPECKINFSTIQYNTIDNTIEVVPLEWIKAILESVAHIKDNINQEFIKIENYYKIKKNKDKMKNQCIIF